LLKTLSLTSRDFEVNAERDSDSARRLREREMSNESFSFSSSSLGVSRNMEGEERFCGLWLFEKERWGERYEGPSGSSVSTGLLNYEISV
jgi:hypothetical protein